MAVERTAGNLKPTLATVTALAVAAFALPTTATAATASATSGRALQATAPPAPYAAPDIMVERESDLSFVPGQPARIKFKLTTPAVAGVGPVGFSVPLTGLPRGFATPVMHNGPFADCQVDEIAQRAWCPDVALFWPSTASATPPVGVGWVTLTVNIAADAPRDLDWLNVPVTISTPTGSAVSVRDFATTRSTDPAPSPEPTKIDIYKHWEEELDRRWSHGWPVRFGVYLRGVTRQVPVVVEQKEAGATTWKTIATLRTNNRGAVAQFATAAHVTSSYRFSFAGDAVNEAASTTVAGPTVQAGAHTFTGPKTGKKGKKANFTVIADPAPRRVSLQWYDYPGGPGWRTQDAKIAVGNGKVILSFIPKKTGKLRLRVVLDGDARAVWSWTEPQFITVK